MKKVSLFLPLLFVLLIPNAYAGLSEGCFPAVQCDAGQDYYSNSCQSHIESVSTTAPSCQSVKGAPAAGNKWSFDCNNGCYQSSIPVAPACPGGIMVGASCLSRIDVLNDNVPVSGEKAYKLYDGAKLTEIVHLDTAGCADGQVPVSDAASPTGWKCGAGGGGLWKANGSDVYYDLGNVGIGTDTPGAALDVQVSLGNPAAMIGSSNNVSGSYAVAMGSFAEASGDNSMAMGEQVTASATAATALGSGTSASGLYSLAAGKATDASGLASFAMGQGAIASNNYAAALGSATTASGLYSFASGNTSTASGMASVAIGNHLMASGDSSAVFGFYSTAQAYNSVVIGRYNLISGTPGSWVATDPLFVIGNGTSDVSRSNALTVLKNGKVGIGTVTPTTLLEVDSTNAPAALIGSNTNTATGYYSVAMGDNLTAQAYNSVIIGRYNLVAGNLSSWVATDPLFVIGNGASNVSRSNALTVLKNGKVGIGTATPGVALDVEVPLGTPAATIGSSSNDATGSYAIAMGNGTLASGEYATAMGYLTTATQQSAIAMGNFSDATGFSSVAMGSSTTSSGNSSTAMGSSTTAGGTASTALGQGTTANGDYSTAMGRSSIASAMDSVAIGRLANAGGIESMAIGGSTIASGLHSTSMGYFSSATGDYSTAIGDEVTAQAYASVVVGSKNLISGNKTSWVATDPVFVVGNGNGSQSNALTVLKNGKVGIGTTAPNATLEVQGTAQITGTETNSFFNFGAAENTYIRPGKNTSTVFVKNFAAESDRRLKTDIQDIGYGLDTVLAMHPVTFKWKDEIDGTRSLGFIAQEMQPLVSEIVTKGATPENPDMLGIKYTEIIPILTAAIQELKAENDSLKAVVCELKPEAKMCAK